MAYNVRKKSTKSKSKSKARLYTHTCPQYPLAFLKICGSRSSISPNRVPCMSPPHPLFASYSTKKKNFRLSSDPNERAYFWLPGSEAASTHELLDSPVSERLYIDQGEIVRVRVERDEFCDDEPGPPKATEGVLISGETRRLPYKVTVSLWSPFQTAQRSTPPLSFFSLRSLL
jgi:RNA polymerase III subunit Rpc25